MGIMRPTRSVDWTKDRIAALATPEVQQLRANAERLNDPEIMERCNVVLGERRKAASAKSRALREGKKKALATGGAA